MKQRVHAIGLVALAGAAASGQVTLDGTADAGYGDAIAIQDTQTQFGDATDGNPGFTNGSELDNASAVVGDNGLYLHFGGNLESNFNKLEIFVDSVSGGQNQLRGDNPDVDFDGLNRMGDDGSGNGLMFDDGFAADHWISLNGGDSGDGNYELFANYAEVLTGGGGTGGFVGGGLGDGDGNGRTITGGMFGIEAAIDNSNTDGVSGGTGAADQGAAEAVSTGVEVFIPFDLLGASGQDVRISAFVNGGSHDFVSNQVLGGIGTGENLGDPRAVNFKDIDGQQHFTVANVPAPGSIALIGLGGLAAIRRRR